MTDAQATQQRRLFVAWRDPETRRIQPVGIFVQRAGAHGLTVFAFAYLKQAERLDRFTPFASFPDLHRAYKSEGLFPMFANRLMPRERPDYGAYVERLDLSVNADPFEVLGRSGGRKTTDRVEVFPEPEVDQASRGYCCLFFARGIRHVEGAADAVAKLDKGDALTLVDDPTNPVNRRAFLLHDPTGSRVGYVPDYLVEFLRDTRELCHREPEVTVEHVNPPEAPAHLRLLCRVRTCRPQGYEPFSGPEFQALVDIG